MMQNDYQGITMSGVSMVLSTRGNPLVTRNSVGCRRLGWCRVAWFWSYHLSVITYYCFLEKSFRYFYTGIDCTVYSIAVLKYIVYYCTQSCCIGMSYYPCYSIQTRVSRSFFKLDLLEPYLSSGDRFSRAVEIRIWVYECLSAMWRFLVFGLLHCSFWWDN